jgi:uncharacterized protein (DUF1810 family)
MDLERFVRAQDSGGTYQRAVAELRNGRKTSHWMWFILSTALLFVTYKGITGPQSAGSPQRPR